MRTARRHAVAVLLGTLLIQLAWALAVPPYHGIDEIDHAYRAAGVAHGQWVLTSDTPDGRGLGVRVPPGMVDSARVQCEALTYMRPDNCEPGSMRDGLVEVSTSAALYNPLYYGVVGWITRVLDGASADYAMRGLTSLLNALLLAAAAFCLSLAGARTWTWMGFAVSLTPVYAYSTMVPAPNALEISTAFLCWAAFLAAARGSLGERVERRLLWLGGFAGAATVVPRLLGPLWVLLMAGVLVLFVGRARSMTLLRTHSLAIWGSVGLVVIATVSSAAWSGYAGLFAESPDLIEGSASIDWAEAMQPLVWNLQVIGAFPFRGNFAPMGVYALWLVPLVGLIVVALQRGRSHARWGVVGALALTQAVPVLLTLVTAESQGVIWQGRYELPLAVGIPVMCGLICDQRLPSERAAPLVLVSVAATAVAHGWSVAHVAQFERSHDEYAQVSTMWTDFPLLILAGTAALGAAIIGGRAVAAFEPALSSGNGLRPEDAPDVLAHRVASSDSEGNSATA